MRTYPPNTRLLALWITFLIGSSLSSIQTAMSNGLAYYMGVGSAVTFLTKQLAKGSITDSSWPSKLQIFLDTYCPIKVPVKAIVEKNINMILVNMADRSLLQSTFARRISTNPKLFDAYYDAWKGSTKAYHMYEAARLLTQEIIPTISVKVDRKISEVTDVAQTNGSFITEDQFHELLKDPAFDQSVSSSIFPSELNSELDKDIETIFTPKFSDNKENSKQDIYPTASRLYRGTAYAALGYAGTEAATFFAAALVNKEGFMKLLPSWLKNKDVGSKWEHEGDIADLLWKMTLIDILIIMSANIDEVFYKKIQDPESWLYSWLGFDNDEPQSQYFKSTYAMGSRLPHVQKGLSSWRNAWDATHSS
ncbi:MAG TPA: hypothetical protein VHA52_06270 [Candidatus Babeliaceae bacterium]|nr:hypothetical protein [Candidatus Babeliaceae bacterium]